MSDARSAAAELADEILADVELSRASLSAVVLKCVRLARLIKDDVALELFRYESAGYPSTVEGIPENAFNLGRMVGRVYQVKEKSGAIKEQMSPLSIGALESQIDAKKIALNASRDPDVSVSSANPKQFVYAPMSNQFKRDEYVSSISNLTKIVSSSQAFAYDYASKVAYELKFSGAASTIFDRITDEMGRKLLSMPLSVSQKTSSISDNLKSENPEDWANAVHSCRRLLQDIADQLFAPRAPEVRGGKKVSLGPDNYINRIMCYVEDCSASERYNHIVGSTLQYLGERLDAVFQAAQKGSHSTIRTKEEAERYVIYTYMTVGDILSLRDARQADPVGAPA